MMSKRISLMFDEIRYDVQEVINLNKEEADLLNKLSRTDDQEERESLIYRIDMINADTFDFIDKIDGYVADLEEALGGDDDEE